MICRTRKWESHIWNSGKQIYLGSFPDEATAARAYDVIALKFRGPDASLNFPIGLYKQDLVEIGQVG